MINEERVKELYQIALYDQNEAKQYRQVEEYYRNDYISKELIKSFFSGTISFLLLLALWFLGDIEGALENLTKTDNSGTIIWIIVLYVMFMAFYLFCTALVYHVRYKTGKIKLKEYHTHLKKVQKMYEREEKLKM